MLLAILKEIAEHIAETLQEQFVSAVLLGLFLFCIWYLAASHFGNRTLRNARGKRLSVISYGMVYLLFFYISMILLKTLLLRTGWDLPWGKMNTSWGIYTKGGKLSTDSIENVLMFIPYTFLLFAVVREQAERFQNLSFGSAVIWSGLAAFPFSLNIELLQGVLSLGAFQWSDLTYNTLGGILGGILSFFLLRPDFE